MEPMKPKSFSIAESLRELFCNLSENLEPIEAFNATVNAASYFDAYDNQDPDLPQFSFSDGSQLAVDGINYRMWAR